MLRSKSTESSRAGYYFSLATQIPNIVYADTSLILAPNQEILKIAQILQKEEVLAKKLSNTSATFGYETLEEVLQLSDQVAKLGLKTNLLPTDKLLEIIELYKDLDNYETIVKIIASHVNPRSPFSAYELRVIASLNYLGTVRRIQSNQSSHNVSRNLKN